MDTSKDIPDCRSCKYCDIAAAPVACTASYRCIHPKVVGKDIVTGILHAGECSDQRKDDDTQCGMTGRLWERRIPWWVNIATRLGLTNLSF